jgi:catechol 1,2-dioxygenase
VDNGGSIVRSETAGPPLFVSARVQDRDGDPVAGAEMDVWHSSPVGLYEHQDAGQAPMNLRGKLVTDDAGRFWFRTVKMAGYPFPPTRSWAGCSRPRTGTHTGPRTCMS